MSQFRGGGQCEFDLKPYNARIDYLVVSFIDMINQNNQELSSSFHVLHDKVRSEAQKVSSAGSPRQSYAFAIFCSIVEHVHGVHSLLEKNPNVAILILRATLEAQVHLILTNKLPNYHERQELNILQDKLSRLENNKDYSHFSNLTDGQVKDAKKAIKKEIKKYEDKGVEQFKKWNKRFEAVEDAEKYVLYQKLCDHVHHDIDVLCKRHLAGSSQSGELTMFKLPDTLNQEGILVELASILVDSLKLLAKISGQDGRLDLEGLDSEYSAFISMLRK